MERVAIDSSSDDETVSVLEAGEFDVEVISRADFSATDGPVMLSPAAPTGSTSSSSHRTRCRRGRTSERHGGRRVEARRRWRHGAGPASRERRRPHGAHGPGGAGGVSGGGRARRRGRPLRRSRWPGARSPHEIQRRRQLHVAGGAPRASCSPRCPSARTPRGPQRFWGKGCGSGTSPLRSSATHTATDPVVRGSGTPRTPPTSRVPRVPDPASPRVGSQGLAP